MLMLIYEQGLRYNHMYLNPLEFARHIGKEDECDTVNDSDCWKVFIKYFHSETSWRSDAKVVFFNAISDPMMFLSTEDTG